jgi:hypothetical protein
MLIHLIQPKKVKSRQLYQLTRFEYDSNSALKYHDFGPARFIQTLPAIAATIKITKFGYEPENL